MLAEIYDREPRPIPMSPEPETALAEAEAATKVEGRTEPGVVSAATVSEETAELH